MKLEVGSTTAPGLRCALVDVGPTLVAVVTVRLDNDTSARALTASEEVIMTGILDGESNEQIAHRRGTSSRTVANQIASIFRKRGVGSRGELVARNRFFGPTPDTSAVLTVVTQAAYANDCDHDPWLKRVIHAPEPVRDAALSAIGSSYPLDAERARRVRACVLRGTPDAARDALEVVLRAAPEVLLRCLGPSPSVAMTVAFETSVSSTAHRLTAREHDVVGRAAMGHSNKRIGHELGLASSTVAGHMTKAAGKLGVRSRVELITRFLCRE